MSMGFKTCPYCNNCEAEAVIAVDNKLEWFCIGCLAEWTEDTADEVEVVSSQQKWMLENFGEE